MCIIQGCECILSQTFILPYIYHKKSAEEEKLEKIETAVTELQGNMVGTGKLLFLNIQSTVAFISLGYDNVGVLFACMQTLILFHFASNLRHKRSGRIEIVYITSKDGF